MKKTTKIISALIAMVSLLLLGWTARSQDSVRVEKPPKTEMKEGTHQMKAGAKQIGHGAKKTAKGAAHKTKRAAKAIGHAVKKTGEDVKEDIKK